MIGQKILHGICKGLTEVSFHRVPFHDKKSLEFVQAMKAKITKVQQSHTTNTRHASCEEGCKFFLFVLGTQKCIHSSKTHHSTKINHCIMERCIHSLMPQELIHWMNHNFTSWNEWWTHFTISLLGHCAKEHLQSHKFCIFSHCASLWCVTNSGCIPVTWPLLSLTSVNGQTLAGCCPLSHANCKLRRWNPLLTTICLLVLFSSTAFLMIARAWWKVGLCYYQQSMKIAELFHHHSSTSTCVKKKEKKADFFKTQWMQENAPWREEENVQFFWKKTDHTHHACSAAQTKKKDWGHLSFCFWVQW